MGKSRIILHLGAHRTGTTGLQNYLKENEPEFNEAGFSITYPPKSRAIDFDKFAIGRIGSIYSEENSAGYMEENIQKGALYPNIKSYLRRFGDIIKSTETVIFSIRDPSEYWTSAILFCLKAKTLILPTEDQLEKISQSARGWSSVVSDIVSEFPESTTVHVKEHEWKLGNPKQQLKTITNLRFIEKTRAVKIVHNPRPAMSSVIERLKSSGDKNSAERLMHKPDSNIFSPEQIEVMKEKYQDDLNKIKKSGIAVLHTSKKSTNEQ